jgi:histidinol dehydrogenase
MDSPERSRVPGDAGEAFQLLYPVRSRRARGLSLGLDLFPDGKRCSYDCPYCEVFPSEGAPAFDPGRLREELDRYAALASGRPAMLPRDISIAGRGEPSLSPWLATALEAAAAARRRHPEVYGAAALVLITNATGFLEPSVSALLGASVEEEGLSIWAKLDAGTESLHAAMSRSAFSLARVEEAILGFSRAHVLTIQTMLCRLAATRGGEALAPPDGEVTAAGRLLGGLLRRGARIGEVQLYTMARPSPEGLCAPFEDRELLRRAALWSEAARGEAARGEAATLPAVRVFGALGELAFGAAGLAQA